MKFAKLLLFGVLLSSITVGITSPVTMDNDGLSAQETTTTFVKEQTDIINVSQSSSRALMAHKTKGWEGFMRGAAGCIRVVRDAAICGFKMVAAGFKCVWSIVRCIWPKCSKCCGKGWFKWACVPCRCSWSCSTKTCKRGFKKAAQSCKITSSACSRAFKILGRATQKFFKNVGKAIAWLGRKIVHAAKWVAEKAWAAVKWIYDKIKSFLNMIKLFQVAKAIGRAFKCFGKLGSRSQIKAASNNAKRVKGVADSGGKRGIISKIDGIVPGFKAMVCCMQKTAIGRVLNKWGKSLLSFHRRWKGLKIGSFIDDPAIVVSLAAGVASGVSVGTSLDIAISTAFNIGLYWTFCTGFVTDVGASVSIVVNLFRKFSFVPGQSVAISFSVGIPSTPIGVGVGVVLPIGSSGVDFGAVNVEVGASNGVSPVSIGGHTCDTKKLVEFNLLELLGNILTANNECPQKIPKGNSGGGGSRPAPRPAPRPASHPIRQSRGYLEVYNRGSWRPVCDDGWNVRASRVVCRQLRKSTSNPRFVRKRAHTSHFWMDNVNCRGNESKLSQCRHNGWGKENCGSSEAFMIVCRGSTSSGSHPIRQSRGYLEVYNRGSWRPVCDDGWNVRASRVVCRQLRKPTSNPRFVRRRAHTSHFWMDNVNCRGNESKLSQCRHNGWGKENCGSSEAFRIDCRGRPAPRPVPSPPRISSSRTVRAHLRFQRLECAGREYYMGTKTTPAACGDSCLRRYRNTRYIDYGRRETNRRYRCYCHGYTTCNSRRRHTGYDIYYLQKLNVNPRGLVVRGYRQECSGREYYMGKKSTATQCAQSCLGRYRNTRYIDYGRRDTNRRYKCYCHAYTSCRHKRHFGYNIYQLQLRPLSTIVRGYGQECSGREYYVGKLHSAASCGYRCLARYPNTRYIDYGRRHTNRRYKCYCHAYTSCRRKRHFGYNVYELRRSLRMETEEEEMPIMGEEADTETETQTETEAETESEIETEEMPIEGEEVIENETEGRRLGHANRDILTNHKEKVIENADKQLRDELEARRRLEIEESENYFYGIEEANSNPNTPEALAKQPKLDKPIPIDNDMCGPSNLEAEVLYAKTDEYIGNDAKITRTLCAPRCLSGTSSAAARDCFDARVAACYGEKLRGLNLKKCCLIIKTNKIEKLIFRTRQFCSNHDQIQKTSKEEFCKCANSPVAAFASNYKCLNTVIDGCEAGYANKDLCKSLGNVEDPQQFSDVAKKLCPKKTIVEQFGGAIVIGLGVAVSLITVGINKIRNTKSENAYEELSVE